MITDRQQHRLVTDYLARLHAEAARRLPADRAAELVDDIAAHLAESVPAGANEVEVRTALDRVGDPADLVGEAGGAAAQTAAPTPATTTATNRLEVAALICLVASLVLFLLVPLAALLLLAGLTMLLLSRRWHTNDKVLGTLAHTVLGAPLLLLAGLSITFISFTQACTQGVTAAGEPVNQPTCTSSGGYLPSWLLVAIAAVWLAFQVYVALRLARRVRPGSEGPSSREPGAVTQLPG
jgi:uncharacterized membrane protein